MISYKNYTDKVFHQYVFFDVLSNHTIEQKSYYTLSIWMVSHQYDVFHAVANSEEEKTFCYRTCTDMAFLLYANIDVSAATVWPRKICCKHHTQNLFHQYVFSGVFLNHMIV